MLPRIFLVCLIGTLCGVTLTTGESQNRPITEISSDLAFRGVAFVPAKVNGGPPMQFLLDTGAGTHIIRYDEISFPIVVHNPKRDAALPQKSIRGGFAALM